MSNSAGVTVTVGASYAVMDNQEEYKNDCKKFMEGYAHKNATQKDMDKYVECQNVLYPESDNEPIWYDPFVQFSVIVLLILSFVGGYKKKKGENKQKRIMFGLLCSSGVLFFFLLLVLLKEL